ncbi:MAG: DUF3795 domain-containing protein [Euryarchaeota archaeon]|nr:DUF3795 domain-containing protein [Euryarchaeota archaeon]
MEKIIAYCGLSCTDCPAYIATQENDDVKREETAKMWSEEFGHDISPEDINCKGCHQDGVVFNYCTKCEIRKCGQEHGVKNCAYCDDYSCEKLRGFFKMAPEAEKSLERIRKDL